MFTYTSERLSCFVTAQELIRDTAEFRVLRHIGVALWNAENEHTLFILERLPLRRDLEDELHRALEHAENSETRYRLREALQLLEVQKMSSDARPSGSDDGMRDLSGGPFPRPMDGLEYQRITRTKPIDHNVTGTFVLKDTETEPPADAPEYSNVPDGSLYQRARVAFLNADEDPELENPKKRVLSREYVPSWLEGDERFAVVLTSSDFVAGTGKGEDYSPFYKYDVTLRRVDPYGEILNENPLHSLTVKIQPNYEDLVYPDGNDYSIPYGEGSFVRVSSTWLEDAGELFTRAQDMLEHALGHRIEADEIATEDDATADESETPSTTLQRQEAHVRFHKMKADDVKHALQQSADLIPHKEGSVSNLDGDANNGTWELFRFQSSDWDLLGHRDTGKVEIGVKIYFTHDPENSHGPFQHPKIEAWLADTKKESVTWSEYEDMQRVLCELVVEHLVHAGRPGGAPHSGRRVRAGGAPRLRDRLRERPPRVASRPL